MMATSFGARRNSEPRSGGKILRDRKAATAARTPYARPNSKQPKPASEHDENPNWLAGLLYPARVIATGAGKILSTVFSADSPSSSSSISDSDSENDDDQNDVSFQGNDQTQEELLSPPVKCVNKCLIEELVMKETFSRGECDELIKLVESRVVDGEAGRLSSSVNRILDVQTTAIAEARKWFQDKKLGSGSKFKPENEIGVSSSAGLPLVAEGEGGSPVDVAKSYMQARPAWTSPSLKHIEFETLSPVGPQHSKEETPRSIFGSSLQPSEIRNNEEKLEMEEEQLHSAVQLKRRTLATGSWNLLDEIRRVRSKATEELLATTASKNIDLSSSSLEHKSRQDSLMNNTSKGEMGDRLHFVNSLVSTLDTNASLDPADGNCHRLPAPAETIHDGSQSKNLLTPAVSASKKNEDDEANQVINDEEGAADAIDAHATPHFFEINSNDRHFSVQDIVDGGMDAATENGITCSISSLSAGLNVVQNPNPGTSDADIIHAIDTGPGKANGENIPVENTALQNAAASAEVPAINEEGGSTVPSGSQDSSSVQQDDVSQDPTWPTTKRSSAAKTKKTPPPRNPRGYSRRSRGK
ncbi:hypothetical protein Ancab_001813 [Ancistrocladus abbreviatus]